MTDKAASLVLTDTFIRNLAVEIADVLDPPDFQRDPSGNVWAIDMAESIIRRAVANLLAPDPGDDYIAPLAMKIVRRGRIVWDASERDITEGPQP